MKGEGGVKLVGWGRGKENNNIIGLKAQVMGQIFHQTHTTIYRPFTILNLFEECFISFPVIIFTLYKVMCDHLRHCCGSLVLF